MASAVGPGPIAGPFHLPGEPVKTSTMMKEQGASLLQSLKPIKQIHQHLCAWKLIITARTTTKICISVLFLTEKKLWHTHEYEVKSGILFLPGVPQVVEHAAMKTIVKTYGKVFHFWQYDRGDSLPLGPPQLMMAFTADGQLQPELAADVEKRYEISFAEKRKDRADLKGPDDGIHPLSNSWTSGKGLASGIRAVESCGGGASSNIRS